MDYWIAQAEAEDQNGDRGTISIKYHERDSEVRNRDEIRMLLQMAARRGNIKILGEMKIVADLDVGQ